GAASPPLSSVVSLWRWQRRSAPSSRSPKKREHVLLLAFRAAARSPELQPISRIDREHPRRGLPERRDSGRAPAVSPGAAAVVVRPPRAGRCGQSAWRPPAAVLEEACPPTASRPAR